MFQAKLIKTCVQKNPREKLSEKRGLGFMQNARRGMLKNRLF